MRNQILASFAAVGVAIAALNLTATDASGAVPVDTARDCITDARAVFTAVDAPCSAWQNSVQIGNPYPRSGQYASPVQSSFAACDAYGLVGNDDCAAAFKYGHAYVGTMSVDRGQLFNALDCHYGDAWGEPGCDVPASDALQSVEPGAPLLWMAS